MAGYVGGMLGMLEESWVCWRGAGYVGGLLGICWRVLGMLEGVLGRLCGWIIELMNEWMNARKLHLSCEYN